MIWEHWSFSVSSGQFSETLSRFPPVLWVDRTGALQVHRGDDSWNVKSILVSSWRSVSSFVLSVKKFPFVHLPIFFCIQGLIFFSFFCVCVCACLILFSFPWNLKNMWRQESTFLSLNLKSTLKTWKPHFEQVSLEFFYLTSQTGQKMTLSRKTRRWKLTFKRRMKTGSLTRADLMLLSRIMERDIVILSNVDKNVHMPMQKTRWS